MRVRALATVCALIAFFVLVRVGTLWWHEYHDFSVDAVRGRLARLRDGMTGAEVEAVLHVARFPSSGAGGLAWFGESYALPCGDVFLGFSGNSLEAASFTPTGGASEDFPLK